jgi:hypothetical protein
MQAEIKKSEYKATLCDETPDLPDDPTYNEKQGKKPTVVTLNAPRDILTSKKIQGGF